MKYLVILVVLAIAAPARADDGDRWDAKTIAEQSAGGIGGGLAGGFTGAFLGAGLGSAGGNKGDWGAGLAGAALGGAAGIVVGVTVGVKLTGDNVDGTGTWLGTGGGALLGGILTVVTLPRYAEKVPGPLAVSLAMTTIVAPAIIGYHLSADAHASTEQRVMIPLMISAF